MAVSLSDGADEACWRSALSRAYYAAYHACNAWHDLMPMPGSVVGVGGSHQRLCSRLRHPAPEASQESARKSRTLGAQLDALRVRRKVADYELKDLVDQAEAKTAAATVSIILQKVAIQP